MTKKYTREEQYQFMIDIMKEKGPAKMSLRASVMWRLDPKLMSFTLARHKFVSKMLKGYSRVLEVGCGPGTRSIFLSYLIITNMSKLIKI